MRTAKTPAGGPFGPPAEHSIDTPSAAFWFKTTDLGCPFPQQDSPGEDIVGFICEFGSRIQSHIGDIVSRLFQPLVLIVRYADGFVLVRAVELGQDPFFSLRYNSPNLPANALAVSLGHTSATSGETQADHEVVFFFSCVCEDALTFSVQ
jgi:hypothetical protein